MNTQQKEIIEMARQVGVDMSLGEHWSFFIEELEAFYKLVADKEQEKFSADLIEYGKAMAAVEREACAKVCDEVGMFHEVCQGADLCFDLSKAIRARGAV